MSDRLMAAVRAVIANGIDSPGVHNELHAAYYEARDAAPPSDPAAPLAPSDCEPCWDYIAAHHAAPDAAHRSDPAAPHAWCESCGYAHPIDDADCIALGMPPEPSPTTGPRGEFYRAAAPSDPAAPLREALEWIAAKADSLCVSDCESGVEVNDETGVTRPCLDSIHLISAKAQAALATPAPEEADR